MAKVTTFSKDKVLHGLRVAAKVVGGTLGPKGQNVYFQSSYPPYEITNDGVTIAQRIEFEDREEDAGAYIIRNITGQTNDNVGDGTTTSAVLTAAIVEECLKRPENPVEIYESLNACGKKLLADLKAQAKTLKKEDVSKVAYISAENEQIANLVAEITEKIGDKAVINVDDSHTFETTYDVVDGYEAKTGFLSPHFATDKKSGKAVFDDVLVVVADKKIASVSDIKPIFDEFEKHGVSQAVFVVNEIDEQVLGMLVVNALGVVGSKGFSQFKSVVVRTSGEVAEDIAGVTGATLIADKTGATFREFKIENCGRAKKVVVDATRSLFITDPEVSQRFAETIKYMTNDEPNMYIQEKNKIRIAKLRGGIATLKIGAPTDNERIYLRRKAEDAVKATQAALEEGVVEGGGLALYKLGQSITGSSIGEQILKKTLSKPLQTIIENAGRDYTEIIKNLPEGKGYDAKADEYVDMAEKGILDPVKVSRMALENAISAAGIFITTSCVVVDAPEKEKTNVRQF